MDAREALNLLVTKRKEITLEEASDAYHIIKVDLDDLEVTKNLLVTSIRMIESLKEELNNSNMSFPVKTGDVVYYWLGTDLDSIDKGYVQTLFVDGNKVVGFTVEFTESRAYYGRRYKPMITHEYDTFSVADLDTIIFTKEPRYSDESY